jgi:hypothetical protein
MCMTENTVSPYLMLRLRTYEEAVHTLRRSTAPMSQASDDEPARVADTSAPSKGNRPK